MRRIRKSIAILLVVVLAFALCGNSFAADDGNKLTILYTNDVHTYIDKNLSYASISAMKQEYAAAGENVLLVDAGDHIQGTAYGAMDEGATIIKLMNAGGYDLATLGNHEFDYGMARALACIEEAEMPYVSCNFMDNTTGKTVLDSYKIFEFDGFKAAFVGITTPETITKSTPAYFMDETQSNWLYSIKGGADGSELYESVQAAVDAARADGADYVIALGHLGDDASSAPWRSVDVIANTTGIDAFIDGHSHSTVEMSQIANKDGKNVVLTQTGSYYAAIGVMTIAADGSISTKLVTEHEGSDEAVAAIQDAWIASVDEQLGTVIGSSEVNLTVNDAEGNRIIRKQESNLGDFCADALYYLFNETEGLDCDVAIMNGGGIRADMASGEITYKTCKTVHTFGNVACLMTITGQQLLDALEWGARSTPNAECGGFLQIAGAKFEIDTTVESSVQYDAETVIWTGSPTGEYRVKNLQIYDKQSGEYVPVDLDAEYNLAGYNYTIRNMGDGFTMFDGATLVKDYVMEDYMVLANYVRSAFEVNEETGLANITADSIYADSLGEGRITILTEKAEGPAEEPAEEPVEEPAEEPVEEPAEEPTGTVDTYTVVKGDNLWKIAVKIYGTGSMWKTIFDANSDTIKDANLIYVGQVLNLK